VKDLVIAHQRQWGWRFADEFCWRKTDSGVPGGWGNRFNNAWEPIFHFCRQRTPLPFPRALIEFFVKAFSDAGDVVFDPFMGSGTTMGRVP
jgi:hypothetical protein